MKPLGREKKIKGFNGKRDVHPRKGYVNWWEAEMNTIISRGSLKNQIKKEIKRILGK